MHYSIEIFDFIIHFFYIPVFDSALKKKVLKPALVADYRTFINFTDARYAFPVSGLMLKRKPGLRCAPTGP